MARVLRDAGIPDDIGVGVKFGIPQTSKRIDFILSGQAADGTPHLVIVELKQWSSSRRDKDGVIVANRGGRAKVEGPHPSYQAWSYAALLNGVNQPGTNPTPSCGPAPTWTTTATTASSATRTTRLPGQGAGVPFRASPREGIGLCEGPPSPSVYIRPGRACTWKPFPPEFTDLA